MRLLRAGRVTGWRKSLMKGFRSSAPGLTVIRIPMQIETFEIDGPLLLRPSRHGDARGWLSEIWSAPRLRAAGFSHEFVQDNLSFSAATGTLRGLHCQIPPAGMGKLVSVVTGAILDVAVDVRENSAARGRHVSVELTEENPAQLWIPDGFLHGFVTLRPDTRVLYKCTAAYSPDHERNVVWNDPELAIDWGVEAPVLSDRDRNAPRLRDLAPLYPQEGM